MDIDQAKDYFLNTEKGRFLLNMFVLLVVVGSAAVAARLIWIYRKRGISLKTERTVQALMKEGEYLEAGELLMAEGDLERALQCFSRIRYYRRMADIYLKTGMVQKAAAMYERDSDYYSAVDVYIAEGKIEAICELYERVPQKQDYAAYLAEKGQKAIAAQLFMQARCYSEAADLYGAMEDYPKAVDALLKKLKFEAVTELTDKIAILRELGRYCQAAGMDKEADAFNEKADNLERSQQAVKQSQQSASKSTMSRIDGQEAPEPQAISGRVSRSSGLSGLSGVSGVNADSGVSGLSGVSGVSGVSRLSDGGSPAVSPGAKASETCLGGNDSRMKSGARSRASEARSRINGAGSKVSPTISPGDEEMHIKESEIKKFLDQNQVAAAAGGSPDLKQYRQAAEVCEKSNEFDQAAELFARAEDYERAGYNYEKARNFKLALQCYETIGDLEKVIEIARYLQEWGKLGTILVSLERWEEAITALEKVPKDHIDYPKAVKLMGTAHYHMGHFSVARGLFHDYEQNWAASKAEKLDSLYHKAVSAEKEENYDEAMKSFQALLKSNYKRDEVSRRLLELDENVNQKRTRIVAGVDGARTVSTRYSREKEIGRGGMAVVYRAKDAVLGRIVALKVLLDSFKKNPQAVEIFLREAKATAILNHPNIVTVYDAGHENDDYYIAMEFIDGRTLKSILKKRKLNFEEVVRYLRQLASGLHYAHEHNIVHRDMTTNNIMIDKNDTLKLMDFGLVKILEKVQAEQSLIGGTPSYMPPEQILGKAVDRRSDIYSYGICVFEMLAGKVPFSGGDASYHHLHSPLPDIRALNPDVPEYFCEILAKCLKKKKEERFQSLVEIMEILNKNSPPVSSVARL